MEVSKTSSAAFLLFLGVLVGLMASPSQGYVFYAGGRDGWVLNPSESYSHWSGRNRFQVNDTIVFKYKKEENSVLVVSKEDFDSCNVEDPIAKLDEGDSKLVFNRSGMFYFISGVSKYCEKGQKLIVLVMAPRPKTPVPSPPSSSSAPTPSPTPATTPSPHAQAPAKDSPSSAPSPGHARVSDSPAPTPSTPKSASSVFRSPVMLVLFMALGAILM